MDLGLQTVFETWSQLAGTVLVLVLAEAVYVSFGFGAGLIAVGLLAALLPQIQDVVVIILLVNGPLEVFVVLRSRSQVEWRGIGLLAVSMIVGIPLGTALLRYEPDFLLILLGAFLVVAGLAFLCFATVQRRRLAGWSMPTAGLLSGFLAGLFGTGGPPLIFYFQLRGVAKAAFRGNLMALFLLITLVRLPVYATGGLIDGPRLASALLVFPGVLLGAWIGHRVHVRLSEAAFRRLVSILLVILGLVLLARA